jgi:hypothetical protein
MVLRILIILAALLLPVRALANDHEPGLSGHWAFRIDDATIFVFTLEQLDSGAWEGAWTRPQEIDSNGAVFRRMSGQETVRPLAALERRGVVQLTFAGPQANGRRDVLQFSQQEENRAQLNYVGIPGDPYPLVRVAADTPLGPFDEVRIYDRDNAVIEADYVELAQPLEPLERVDLAESEGAAATEEGEEGEMPRITADFLDGL